MSGGLTYALLANAWAFAWVLTGHWLCVVFCAFATARELCAAYFARIEKDNA